MQNSRGITIIEVLASVVVLSVGIAACYRPLLASLDALHYSDERMQANYALSEEMWKLSEKVLRGEKLKEGSEQNSVSLDPFHYEVQKIIRYQTEDGRLLSAKLRASWIHSERSKSILGEMYLVAPERDNKIA